MEIGQCSLCHQATAKFTCFCTSPPDSICAVCIAGHLESRGSHHPVSIQNQENPHVPVEEANESCDGCRGKAARTFCTCSLPLKKLCAECDIKHYENAPEAAHFRHPVGAYALATSGKVPMATFDKKQRFISSCLVCIGQELNRFHAFKTQVEDEFDALIKAVTERKGAVLEKIITAKTQLSELLGKIPVTIRDKRHVESAEAVTPFENYILNGYESETDYDLRLFTGTLELQGIEEIVENSVSVEVFSSLLEQERSLAIPVLKGSNVRLFNRKTLQMTQFDMHQQYVLIDSASAYCFIGPMTVFAVGGQNHSETYVIDVSTGKIERGPNMTTIRGWMGIINYGQCVFAIGGLGGGQSLNTAEKYGIVSKSWTPLPNTLETAKYCISVCEHTSGLYISGIDGSGSSVAYTDSLHR